MYCFPKKIHSFLLILSIAIIMTGVYHPNLSPTVDAAEVQTDALGLDGKMILLRTALSGNRVLDYAGKTAVLKDPRDTMQVLEVTYLPSANAYQLIIPETNAQQALGVNQSNAVCKLDQNDPTTIWAIAPNKNGTYCFENMGKKAGSKKLMMDVKRANPNTGTPVQLYSKNGKNNQNFAIEIVTLNISKQYLTPNPYSRPQLPLKKVTKVAWHYVQNPGSTAQFNRDYFEHLKDTKTRKVSSHYVIGLEGEIIQCIPENEYSYATNQANSYAISIEVCHPDVSGKFTYESEQALIALTADILARHGLTANDIIRHYDVTGKICPKYYVENPKDYQAAKNSVTSILEKRVPPVPVEKPNSNTTKKELIQALQAELNRQFNKNIAVDGVWGAKTKSACVTVRKGAQGNITKILQQALNLQGDQIVANGTFGSETEQAVKNFQKKKGLPADGRVDKNTWEKLLK